MTQKYCLHCHTKLKPNEVDFCCIGCKTAYKIINNLGFKKYYDFREVNANTTDIKPEEQGQKFQANDISEFVSKDKDGAYYVNLIVQGMHCAACVWLIENILNKQEKIQKARINLSKKTLYLKWHGQLEDGNIFIKIIQQIGYKLLPFDNEIIIDEQKKYDSLILKSLAVAGFGAGNVMLFSLAIWFSDLAIMGPQTKNLLHYFASLIALPVIIYAIRPFIFSAYKSLKAGYPNMDFAISVAIILTAFTSTFQIINKADHIYFDSALMLLFFLLVGRYLENKVRKKAFSIATEFSLLSAGFARIKENNKIKTIPIKKLKKGMIIYVAVGEKIAGDGVVIDGVSEVDSSIIDGEVMYKKIIKDSEVFAGCINISAPLTIKVTRDCGDSMISQIIALSDRIDNSKNKFINISNKLSAFYVPAVHLIAILAFIYWLSLGWQQALLIATTILIITCPCALALAVPIAQTIAVSRLIKYGILIKSGEALEKLRLINNIIFDKTGTLTKGNLKLKSIINLKDNQELDLTKQDYYLKLAASMAQNSNHPICKSLLNSYGKELLDLKIEEKKGFGLVTKYQNKTLKLGRKDFCNISKLAQFCDVQTFLKFGDEELVLLFSDDIKDDAKKVITKLNDKLNVTILSGDVKENVRQIANKLNVKKYLFGQSPITKANFLQNIRNNNEKFIMVGDGVNDAPSLKLADVSISFNNACDISQNISDIIIQGQKLQPIVTTINASKQTIKIIKQNLTFALIYNICAISLAITGNVTPLIAAISMSASSLIVLLNSLRLKFKIN